MQLSSQVTELSQQVLISKNYITLFLHHHLNQEGENKNSAVLYDIADDISNNDKSPNYTLNHLFERIKIYNQENFDYEIVNIKFRK